MAGRPKLSDAEKARRAAERELAKANGVVPVVTTRERRNPLQLAIAAASDLLAALTTLEAYRGRKGLFEAEEYAELCELDVNLAATITAASREQSAISPQIEAMTEKAEMLALMESAHSRIAELEAELAARDEQLRVAGHGRNMPGSVEVVGNALKVVKERHKPASKTRTAEQALTEENAA